MYSLKTKYKVSWRKHTLYFKKPSGTSRGILKKKDSYFIILEDEQNLSKKYIGECGLLKGLSIDTRPDYEDKLTEICNRIEYFLQKDHLKELYEFPSIQFGLEMLALELAAENPHILFPSSFTNGTAKQAINGLIWMGDASFMKQQIREKLDNGFNCIKMKIGAIDFDTELALLKSIRKEFNAKEIQLRVDANGAFLPDKALEKLKRLAELELHSIEQPIKAGQWEEMAALCADTPLDIALDEELIGVFSEEKKIACLSTIKPQYIILKPSLIGGIAGSETWIKTAEALDIDWWATSALESNLGLNAIAQWTYTKNSTLHQGLGTGQLYTNNFDSPLKVASGYISYKPNMTWNLQNLWKDE